MHRYVIFPLLLMLCSSVSATEETTSSHEVPAGATKNPPATSTSATTPTHSNGEEAPETKSPSTSTPTSTNPQATQATSPPDEKVSKEKILNSLSKMTPKEMAELMNFISTIAEKFGTGTVPLEEPPSKEKISTTIKQMSPKEVAELMNFLTTMEEDVTNSGSVPEENSKTVPTAVTDTLKRIVSGTPSKTTVVPSPLPGLYEAMLDSEVIYISADGRYVIMGDVRDIQTGRNLTEEKRNQVRVDAINSLDEKEMVVFTPQKETKEIVNVFTDVDCPYCSKFHQSVDKLNEAGIKVRYLAFPRAGVGSDTYKKMVSVWCAKDKQKAMTAAKARQEVESATCENPVEKQYELGKKIGVQGTPALVLSTGELIPGYVPPERLIPYVTHQVPNLGLRRGGKR